jgi:hypothetical protein
MRVFRDYSFILKQRAVNDTTSKVARVFFRFRVDSAMIKAMILRYDGVQGMSVPISECLLASIRAIWPGVQRPPGGKLELAVHRWFVKGVFAVDLTLSLSALSWEFVRERDLSNNQVLTILHSDTRWQSVKNEVFERVLRKVACPKLSELVHDRLSDPRQAVLSSLHINGTNTNALLNWLEESEVRQDKWQKLQRCLLT